MLCNEGTSRSLIALFTASRLVAVVQDQVVLASQNMLKIFSDRAAPDALKTWRLQHDSVSSVSKEN